MRAESFDSGLSMAGSNAVCALYDGRARPLHALWRSRQVIYCEEQGRGVSIYRDDPGTRWMLRSGRRPHSGVGERR